VRGIVWQESAREAADDALEKWDGAELAIQALEWGLSRDEIAGDPIHEGGKVRSVTLDGARSRNIPSVTVIYETDPQTVTLHSAFFEDSRYDQSGQG
jgi:hypothetical protein